jgi:PadR family transcriptional regulator PadR
MLKGGDAYASLIISSLKDARMIVVEGTLYTLLTRLKNQGLLNYRWEESTQGPPRKYYSLTANVHEALVEMDTAWNETVACVEAVKRK